MSRDEISEAFAHPLARARASHQGARLPDRISLSDHVVEVEIGAFAAERGVRQRLAFNLVVEVSRPERDPGDDVDRVLSYDRLVEAIGAELAARRFDLLETLAEGIAARVLAHPLAERVFVRIEKLDRGPGALGVEIVRSAGQAQAEAQATPAPAPLLVLLPAPARNDPALAGFLDRLAAAAPPALLLTGQPDAPAPEAATPAARARIALLAADQAAWQLSATDKRLTVAASLTEIDFALSRRQMAVWAPARLILAAARPPAHPEDPLARAAWLARKLHARALLLVGDKPPAPPPALAEIPLLTARLADQTLPSLA